MLPSLVEKELSALTGHLLSLPTIGERRAGCLDSAL